MLWLLTMTLVAPAAAAGASSTGGLADPTADHIAAVHSKSAALRRQLLKEWTLEPDATPTPGYYSTFAGAPIQHIIAAMYLNENATAVALAQTALASPNMSSDFRSVYEWTCVARAFALFNSKASGCAGCATMHPATELAMKDMLFRFADKNNGAAAFCDQTPPSQGGGSMCTSGSENLDYDAKTSGYVALRELSKFPEYRNRRLGSPPPPPPVPPAPPVPPSPSPSPSSPSPPPSPPRLARCQHCCKAGCGLKCCSPAAGPQKCCCLERVKTPDKCPLAPPPPPPPPPAPPRLTVAAAAAEWDLFFYNKLKDQALAGLFSENGSPNYWYRTWPAFFNLADLGSTRVRQRATMFIDLAFVEGESLQVGGFRAGAKMRSKKDGGDYPVFPANDTTSPIVAYVSRAVQFHPDGTGVNSISFGSPHVRPMWALSTCGA